MADHPKTTEQQNPSLPQTALRTPDEVMKLDRMGAFFPTRLSFMRSLIRNLAREKASLETSVWDIDGDGFGRAVLSIAYGGHFYSLVAFSHRLDPSQRTDRVIAEAWDSTFCLFDGKPTETDLDRLEANAPRQEAGRFEATELTLSRANKSVRFFEHTVESLARGEQPDQQMVQEIGYLMRTTAVYGNGKFGIADRAVISGRTHMSEPFQAEMLTVWLIRSFSHLLVEHIAKARGKHKSVSLDQNIKRHLGIGNSTGLGMAPFLVNHPILLNNWMMVRETAIARCRAATAFDPKRANTLVERASSHLKEWNVRDQRQMARVLELRKDWSELHNDCSWQSSEYPWDALYEESKKYGLECQELTVALMLEANGPLVDGLTECMGSDFEPRLEPGMNTKDLLETATKHAGWALDIDFSQKDETAQFWYVSEEKLEPRLGDRYAEPGAEVEAPLDIAREIQNLVQDLKDQNTTVAEFLMKHPQHRNAARRVQCLPKFQFAEIRDNLIGKRCLPIDMLRTKLSFFGASKFDPKSDRWTRITLYQGAPLPDELASKQADDWWLPCFQG